MSEVKRPTRPTWSFNWPKSLTQYADDMDRWVAELEAERDRLQECVDNRDHDLEVRSGHVKHEQDKVAELEAERDLLRDNLKRIRDAVWETGVCGVQAKREPTHD